MSRIRKPRRFEPLEREPSEVRTAPCPRCRSFNTRAYLSRGGVVLLRACLGCWHEWDREKTALKPCREPLCPALATRGDACPVHAT